MKVKIIYECQSCKDMFDKYAEVTVGTDIPTQLEKLAKPTIHACQYEVWGVATPIRFEGPIVSGVM